jgi:hypothetical protein
MSDGGAVMSINAAAIANSWNEPIPELDGTPLTKDGRIYALGRTFELSIVLKDKCTKSLRIVADRRVDAFIELVTTAEAEGWVDDISRVDIDDVTGRFE